MSTKAFNLLPVLDRYTLLGEKAASTNSKIECVECRGQDLFLGFTDSSVLRCQLEEAPLRENLQLNNCTDSSHACPPFACAKVMQRSLGGRRPVLQMTFLSALSRLLVLCDGILHVLDSETLASTGIVVKNVSRFAVSENPMMDDPFVVELGVARKTSVMVYVLTLTELKQRAEFSLNSPAVAVAMDGPSLCLALGAGPLSCYTILNWPTGIFQELFPFQMDRVTPCVLRIQKGEFLLSAVGNLGMFASVDGISQRPPVPWLEAVSHIAYAHPYLLAMNDSMVAVYGVFDQLRKQTVPFVGGGGLKNFDGRIFVWSGSAVMYLHPVPWETQVQSLISAGRVQEALSLALQNQNSASVGNNVEKNSAILRNIRQKAGFVALTEGDYAHAAELFEDGEVDPREVLCLCPSLQSPSMVSSFTPASPPLHTLPPNFDFLSGTDTFRLRKNQEFMVRFLETRRAHGSLHKRELDTGFVLLLAAMHSPRLLPTLSAGGLCCDTFHVLAFFRQQGLVFAQVLLLRSEGKHREALRICEQLIRGELTDSAFEGIIWVAEYLGSLADFELVSAFAPGILSQDSKLVSKIFQKLLTGDTSVESHDLSMRLHIEDFLRNSPEVPKDALIFYLEHLIQHLDIQDEGFHTRLAQTYASAVVDTLQREVHLTVSPSGSNITESSETVPLRGGLSSDTVPLRRRFQRHLRTSQAIRIPILLREIESTCLQEETAILYGRLGDYKKAISTLVHVVDDPYLALEYCQTEAEPELRKRLLLLLLKTCLDPAQTQLRRDALSPVATSLLHSSADEFKFSELLSVLPCDWGMERVTGFLRRALRASVHRRMTSQIQCSLARGENLQKKFALMLLQKEQFLLKPGRYCPHCHKRFNDNTFVAIRGELPCHVQCAGRLVGSSTTSVREVGSVGDGDYGPSRTHLGLGSSTYANI